MASVLVCRYVKGFVIIAVRHFCFGLCCLHSKTMKFCITDQCQPPLMVLLFYFRPNLFLSVGSKCGDIAMDLKTQMKKVGNKYTFSGPTIIYCPTKKVTMDVANVLKGYKSFDICRVFPPWFELMIYVKCLAFLMYKKIVLLIFVSPL